MDLEVLDEATWRGRAAAHEARIDSFVVPHLARRKAREKHPVHDFLFTYYSQKPAALRPTPRSRRLFVAGIRGTASGWSAGRR